MVQPDDHLQYVPVDDQFQLAINLTHLAVTKDRVKFAKIRGSWHVAHVF